MKEGVLKKMGWVASLSESGRLHLKTLGQGGWLLFAIAATGVFNYFYHVFGGRTLGPAGYGIFAALNSFSLILWIVAGVIQTVVTNYVAQLWSDGKEGEAGAPRGRNTTCMNRLTRGPRRAVTTRRCGAVRSTTTAEAGSVSWYQPRKERPW